MEYTKFEKLRKELFTEAISWQEISSVTDKFKNDFMKLIELCTLSLMKGDDNFFALFIIQMKREIKLDLPTAISSRPSSGSFTMYINPVIFLECSLNEMQALLKHEVYHIMSLHYIRAKSLRKKYSPLAVSVAMDISINQYILYLPVWAEKIENARMTYHVDLKDEQTMEEYAEEIQGAIDRMKRERTKECDDEFEKNDELFIERQHDMSRAHDLWYYNEENYDSEQIKEVTRKVVDNAAKGEIPESVNKLMKQLNKKAEVSWKDYLKRMLGTLPAGYKKTVTRRDRRQPDRMDLRGKLSSHIAQIIIALDISGSMSDKEIEQIMTEIFSIVKNYPREITIIECDSEIRRIYNVRSIKDIKEKVNTRGGTRFSPVFQYIEQHKMRNHILVYFTDGQGETELMYKKHNKTLWVLTGDCDKLSLSSPSGIVKKLSSEKKETVDIIEYVKSEMKDIRGEWAK